MPTRTTSRPNPAPSDGEDDDWTSILQRLLGGDARRLRDRLLAERSLRASRFGRYRRALERYEPDSLDRFIGAVVQAVERDARYEETARKFTEAYARLLERNEIDPSRVDENTAGPDRLVGVLDPPAYLGPAIETFPPAPPPRKGRPLKVRGQEEDTREALAVYRDTIERLGEIYRQRGSVRLRDVERFRPLLELRGRGEIPRPWEIAAWFGTAPSPKKRERANLENLRQWLRSLGLPAAEAEARAMGLDAVRRSFAFREVPSRNLRYVLARVRTLSDAEVPLAFRPPVRPSLSKRS